MYVPAFGPPIRRHKMYVLHKEQLARLYVEPQCVVRLLLWLAESHRLHPHH